MAVTEANTGEKAMKTRLFFVSVLRFALDAVVRFFAAITVIFICIPAVLGPIAIISEIPDVGTRFFVGLCLSIPYLGVAMAITAFSIDNEARRQVTRQRQMHRVQAMLEQIEELERLAERLAFE
jgi:hypothetical protein